MSISDEFASALSQILPEQPRLVAVASSLRDLLPPPGFKPDDVLGPLMALADQGWTLAFAAYTFSFCGTGRYHARDSRSETGLLADWVLEGIPGAVRMRHPIYSYVMIGPRAVEFATACSPSTCFGDDGPFGLFERVDALQLGLGTVAFSQWHRYEETERVPYRYMKTFEGMADWADGSEPVPVATDMYVRDLAIDPESDSDDLFAKLDELGMLRSAPLWRGAAYMVETRILGDVVREMLRNDPYFLLECTSAARAKNMSR